jgi:hypothetical protein
MRIEGDCMVVLEPREYDRYEIVVTVDDDNGQIMVWMRPRNDDETEYSICNIEMADEYDEPCVLVGVNPDPMGDPDAMILHGYDFNLPARLKKYYLDVVERKQYCCEIEADSNAEAKDVLKKMYYSGELDGCEVTPDYNTTDFTVYSEEDD